MTDFNKVCLLCRFWLLLYIYLAHLPQLVVLSPANSHTTNLSKIKGYSTVKAFNTSYSSVWMGQHNNNKNYNAAHTSLHSYGQFHNISTNLLNSTTKNPSNLELATKENPQKYFDENPQISFDYPRKSLIKNPTYDLPSIEPKMYQSFTDIEAEDEIKYNLLQDLTDKLLEDEKPVHNIKPRFIENTMYKETSSNPKEKYYGSQFSQENNFQNQENLGKNEQIPKIALEYPTQPIPSFGYEIDLTTNYPTSTTSSQNSPIYPKIQENYDLFSSDYSFVPRYPSKTDIITKNVSTNQKFTLKNPDNSQPTIEQHSKDNMKHYFETLKYDNQELIQPAASSNQISLPPLVDSKAVSISDYSSNKKENKNWSYKLENYREPITKPDQIKRSLPSFYLYDPYQFKNRQYAQLKKKNESHDDLNDFDAIFADNTPDKIHDYKIDHSQYDGENKEKRLSASYFKSTVFDGSGQPIYEARTELSNEERQSLGLKAENPEEYSKYYAPRNLAQNYEKPSRTPKQHQPKSSYGPYTLYEKKSDDWKDDPDWEYETKAVDNKDIPVNQPIVSVYGLQQINDYNSASYQYVKIAHLNGGNLAGKEYGKEVHLSGPHDLFPDGLIHHEYGVKDGLKNIDVPEVYENAVEIVRKKLKGFTHNPYTETEKPKYTSPTEKYYASPSTIAPTSYPTAPVTPLYSSPTPYYKVSVSPTPSPYEKLSYSPTPSPYYAKSTVSPPYNHLQPTKHYLPSAAPYKQQRPAAILNPHKRRGKHLLHRNAAFRNGGKGIYRVRVPKNGRESGNGFLRKHIQNDKPGSYSHQSFSW